MLQLWVLGVSAVLSAGPAVASRVVCLPVKECRFVVGEPLSAPEGAALALLQRRAREVAGTALHVERPGARPPRGGIRVLLGTADSNPLLRRPLGAPGVRDALRGVEVERAVQSYVVQWRPRGRGGALVAAGVGAQGAAYALCDLASGLVSGPDGPALLVRGTPGRSGDLSRVEVPRVADRGEYLNIPAPLPPLTVHTWDDARWQEYLDQLLAARANRLYFYLWMDSATAYPGSSLSSPENRRLHERLRWMIPHAQRRGLRVILLFTPTYLPRDLWEAHPELHAQIEYVDHGFPCICPSHPASWGLMHAVHGWETEWFRQADGFQLWFYDPGGCLCPRCTADLAAPLLRQVEAFAEAVRRTSPCSEFQVSLWPIWLWEARLGRAYGTDLLDRIRARFPSPAQAPTIVDSADHPNTFLKPARQKGFRTQAFLFPTNVETPFVFLHPQIAYLRTAAQGIASAGYTGAFCHRLYPGSKLLNTRIALAALWDPSQTGQALARDAAVWAMAHSAAAEELARALLLWDELLCEGASAAKGQEVLRRVEGAAALLPPRHRAGLEWLETTARALAILSQGVESRGDAARSAALAAQLRALLAASPAFRQFAGVAESNFDTFTAWMAQGWNRAHF